MDTILRPWRPEDAASVAILADNPKIAANLRDAFPSPYEREHARAFIDNCLNCDSDTHLHYAVDRDGRAVGSVGIRKKDDVYRKSAEIGYWLGEPYWGGGLMSRAVHLASRIAFSTMDIVRIFAEPFAHNAPSCRVLEKSGYVLEGILKKSIIKDGKIGDSCVYALLGTNGDEQELSKKTQQELWTIFPILLTEHKREWAVRYALERDVLYHFLGVDTIRRLSHIGSTAVKGLAAKPTIDILLEIDEETDLDALRASMKRAGYLVNDMPENPPPHLMCLRGYTANGFEGQAFHVHVRYPGDWNELYFRDYLRTAPDAAAAYGKLKETLASAHRHDRDAYTQAKTDFITRATDEARRVFGGLYVPVDVSTRCR